MLLIFALHLFIEIIIIYLFIHFIGLCFYCISYVYCFFMIYMFGYALIKSSVCRTGRNDVILFFMLPPQVCRNAATLCLSLCPSWPQPLRIVRHTQRNIYATLVSCWAVAATFWDVSILRNTGVLATHDRCGVADFLWGA